MFFVLGSLRLLRWCAHEAREKAKEGHFESRAPTGWYLKVGKVVSCAQGLSYDDGEAVALLRGRVCFVLGLFWLLGWCARKAMKASFW